MSAGETELRGLLRIAAARAATLYLEAHGIDREEERQRCPLTFTAYESELEGALFGDLAAAAAGDLDTGGLPTLWEADEWEERRARRLAKADDAYAGEVGK